LNSRQQKKIVQNATEVMPGIYVSNSSSSIFVRTGNSAPKAK